MSDSAAEETQFWQLMDELIEKANSASSQMDLGVVNAALMQASARFSAFYLAASSESRNDLKEDKEESIHRFGGDYKRRLADNLEDYIENYKVYMREE